MYENFSAGRITKSRFQKVLSMAEVTDCGVTVLSLYD